MPKEAAIVVTGENRAEFMAKRLNLEPAPAPIEVKTEVVEPSDKTDAKDTKDANATDKQEVKVEDKEEKDPLQKRFDKLTFEREEAKREAEREKAEAAKERDATKKEREARQKAEEEARALKAKYEPPKTEPDPKPTRAQFQDDAEYEKAIDDWTTDKVNRERDEKEAQARRSKAWSDRVAATRTKLPDYQEVINASDLRVSDEMRDAIIESDIGPELQYYFVKNPDEATRFGGMTVRGMLIAMGKLEAKLGEAPKTDVKETPKSEQTPPEKTLPKVEPVAEISKAPAPETPLKGANAPIEPPVNSAGEFVGTYAEWKALRKAKKI